MSSLEGQLLTGRVAIVTGGASPRGIGKATARALAAQGARIAILDLDGGLAAASAADVGDGHIGVGCDVTDRAACLAAVARVAEHFGRIDVLVNNAGITQPVRLMDITPEGYEAVTDVSVRGSLYMTQAVVPHMRACGAGSVICMSSVSAQRGGGIFGGPHYSAAKGGVLGLARAMARELGPDRIRVNAIAPGLIRTDITGDKLTPEVTAEIVRSVPIGRLGEAQDVAGCCVFLASDLSAYVTGATLDVNGGMHIH